MKNFLKKHKKIVTIVAVILFPVTLLFVILFLIYDLTEEIIQDIADD